MPKIYININIDLLYNNLIIYIMDHAIFLLDFRFGVANKNILS